MNKHNKLKCIVCKGTFSKNKFSKTQQRKRKKAPKCVACIEEARKRRLQSAVVEPIDMRKKMLATPVIPVPIASTKVLGKRKKRDEKDEVEVYYNGKWYVAKSVDRKKKKIVVRWKNGTVTEYEKTEFQSRKKERKKSSIPFWSIG